MTALRCSAAFLFFALCAFVGPTIVRGATAAPVHVAVEFLPDGRCSIREVGNGFRADLTYLPPASSSPDLRCTIPSPPKGYEVDLVVRLPPDLQPGAGEFPRLTWREEDGRWSGSAALPAAPAFVHVPQRFPPASASTGWPSTPSTDASVTFGWNFYGWFVFSAAFITTYFAWARLTAGSKDLASTATASRGQTSEDTTSQNL
jgi:hypothetical protein